MIINFSVQNFGCIKDKVTLSFEATKSEDLEDYYIIEPKKGLRLLKLGLIYGPNASGKTTILQALDFLRNIVLNPLAKKTDSFDFQPFLFDENTPNENTSFSLEFIQKQVKYLYEVELNQKAIIGEKLYFYKPNKALVYKRETETEQQLSTIQFGSKIRLSGNYQVALEGNTLWNNTVLGGFLKTNFESLELQEVTNWFDSKLETLIDTDSGRLLAYILEKIENKEINKDSLIGFLKRADFNIRDFKVVNNPIIRLPKIHKGNLIAKMLAKDISFYHVDEHNKNVYRLDYFSESKGTQRYFQFAGLLELLLTKQFILSIDEIESSLHSDLLEHFLLTFLVNSKDSQLIATTHHRELLMQRDILRQDAIWFTEKKSDGSADLFSLTDFDSSVIRRDTSSIYNAYKAGKLGAIPNLGNYFLETADGKK